MRIAVAQTPGTRLEDWRETRGLIDEMLARCAASGAGLAVIPECIWPAYCLGSVEAYRAARAGGMPPPEAFLSQLQAASARLRLAVCAGYVEERDGALYNAACLIDAGGVLRGVHRKCFLWDFDHDTFAPGDVIEPVEMPFGSVGVMICADARLPEIPATLAARGVNLIVQPTGWVNAGTPERPWNPQPDFLIAARAAEFGVPVASASKWGPEIATTFVGSSLICDATGNVCVQAEQAETTVLSAEVALGESLLAPIPPEERAVLSSEADATYPRGDVGPLRVMPWTGASGAAGAAEGAGSAPTLWLSPGPGAGRGGAAACVVSGPMAGIVEVGGVRIGAISDRDACRFGAVRVRALRGAHVVVVYGAQTREILVQARACENRVFVIWVTERGYQTYDPRGLRTHAGQWTDAAGLSLDVAFAAAKEAAPRTDMLRGRRPGLYTW
jgi:predicted amidohydrolase